MLVIGIDVGRNAVKVSWNGAAGFMFPALANVWPPRANGLQQIDPADRVTLGGQEYVTGKSAAAHAWSREAQGAGDDFCSSITHDVLLASALERLKTRGAVLKDAAVLAVGVPSRVYSERADLVRQLERRVRRCCSAAGFAPVIRVHAQAIAVAASELLGDDGERRDGAADVAVIDVGQATVDFAAIHHGSPDPRCTSSSDGIHLVIDHVRAHLAGEGLRLPTADLEELWETKAVMANGEQRDITDLLEEGITRVLMPRIRDGIRRAFGDEVLQSVSRVIVAGGGASLVVRHLQQDDLTRHAVSVQDPRAAVARGLMRLAAAEARQRPGGQS